MTAQDHGRKIGHGIFMWDAEERRSDRYGYFFPSPSSYDGKATAEPLLDAGDLDGKIVRIVAVVRESRKSGHIGDLFHKIFPTTPEVGEVVDLGVGKLLCGTNYDGAPQVGLEPLDGRDDLWIDPHKLYRLHDQTVDLYADVLADADARREKAAAKKAKPKKAARGRPMMAVIEIVDPAAGKPDRDVN